MSYSRFLNIHKIFVIAVVIWGKYGILVTEKLKYLGHF